MSIENRLRNHLHDQGDAIDIDSDGLRSVAARSRARRQRRQGLAFATIAVTIAAVGGWLVGTLGGNPSTLEVAGDADSSTTTVGELATETVGDDTGAALGTIAGAADPAIEIDELVRPEPGTPLAFAPIGSADAPGGYNVYQNGFSDGLYYVVSTGPGVTYEDAIDRGLDFPRNDTLYTWAGDAWAIGSFGDRFVSSITGANDLLYTVSTGRPGGAALEVGTSGDGGASWSWQEIDLSAQFGDDPSTWPAYRALAANSDDGRLVVVSKSPGADWDQAIRLAQQAGLDISWENNSIHNVTSQGITYGDSWEDLRGPCAIEYEDHVFGPILDGVDYPGDDASEEAIAAFAAAMDAQEAEFDAREAEILDELAGRAECGDFVACRQAAGAHEDAFNDGYEALFESFGVNQYSDFWGDLTDEQLAAVEELEASLSDLEPDYPDGIDCELELYGWSENVEFDTITATWESLGVTPPQAWEGSIGAYLVTDDGVEVLDTPFDAGYLESVESGSDGFVVTISDLGFDLRSTEVIEEPFIPEATRWSGGVDGWTSSVGEQPFGVAEFGRAQFSVSWDESSPAGGSILVRSDAAGSVGMQLEDLAPEIDTSGHDLFQVKSGDFGVVAIAVEWSPAGTNSIVLYSSDGMSWGATELAGVEAVDAIVGDDGVMVFTTSPGSDSPAVVLLGS